MTTIRAPSFCLGAVVAVGLWGCAEPLCTNQCPQGRPGAYVNIVIDSVDPIPSSTLTVRTRGGTATARCETSAGVNCEDSAGAPEATFFASLESFGEQLVMIVYVPYSPHGDITEVSIDWEIDAGPTFSEDFTVTLDDQIEAPECFCPQQQILWELAL